MGKVKGDDLKSYNQKYAAQDTQYMAAFTYLIKSYVRQLNIMYINIYIQSSTCINFILFNHMKFTTAQNMCII
jgi:hypothetical protein